jgi:hypothetical protein
MIRALRHYTGVTGPESYEVIYETRLFSCPELEDYISGKNGMPNASYGFTGLEIVDGPDSLMPYTNAEESARALANTIIEDFAAWDAVVLETSEERDSQDSVGGKAMEMVYRWNDARFQINLTQLPGSE